MIGVPVFFGWLVLDPPKFYALALVTLSVWLLFCLPQLYLISQYIKVTDYQSMEIDYHEKCITISKENEKVVRSFAEIRRVVFYAPYSPIYLGILWRTVFTQFYYYRIDFDDESYYLTSLVFPNPILNGERDFYDTYIEVQTILANIKKAK